MATAARLMKLTAAALKAACIDMQLVQERDGRHGLPASTVFAPAEIATLESAQPDAGRQYRKAGKPPSRAEPRLGGLGDCALGDCAPGMLGLLRKAARAHHHASWYGALQGDPSGIPSRPGSATRCENPLVQTAGYAVVNAADASAALLILRQAGAVDLLLTDF